MVIGSTLEYSEHIGEIEGGWLPSLSEIIREMLWLENNHTCESRKNHHVIIEWQLGNSRSCSWIELRRQRPVLFQIRKDDIFIMPQRRTSERSRTIYVTAGSLSYGFSSPQAPLATGGSKLAWSLLNLDWHQLKAIKLCDRGGTNQLQCVDRNWWVEQCASNGWDTSLNITRNLRGYIAQTSWHCFSQASIRNEPYYTDANSTYTDACRGPCHRTSERTIE